MNKSDTFIKMIQEADSTKHRLLYSAIFLFSTKGYDNVGIRELTSSVSIKESAFYNHYRSKEILFTEILNLFMEISSKPVFTNEEIEEIMKSGNIEHFLKKNMEVYINISGSPLYCTLLQIILMESYTNPKAWQVVKYTDYYLQLEKILEEMMSRGYIRNMNIKAVTASYYYGIKGIMQEFILKEVWDEDTSEMIHLFENHIDLFIKILISKGD